MVVPITAEKNGRVFRAYRHGEDVQFSEALVYLFQITLSEFIKTSARVDGIPRIWIEKVLAILIRILVQKRLVNPVYRHLDSSETVGIRYSLHGAVVRVGQPKLYGPDESDSLLENLQERGMLSKSQTGCYLVNEIDGIAPKDAEHVAISIGQVFGMLAQPANAKIRTGGINLSLTNKELILLGTCINDVDVAAALAAELDIVARSWSRLSKIFQNSSGQKINVIKSVRSDVAFRAMNNGEWKFTSVRKGLPWNAVHAVRERFGDRVLANLWDSFWPTQTQVENPSDINIERLVNEQGSMLLKISIYVRLLEISAHCRAGDYCRAKEIALEVNHLRDEFANFCSGPESLDIARIVDILNDRLQSQAVDCEKLHRYAYSRASAIVDRISSVLAQVDLFAFQYGKPMFINRYEHALYVRILAKVVGHEKIFSTIRELMLGIARKASSASRSATIAFPSEDKPEGMDGFWVLAKGEFSRRWLVRLASEITDKVGVETPLQFVLFPNLSSDMAIYQNGMESIYRNSRFWSYVNEFILSVLPRIGNNAVLIADSGPGDHIESVINEMKEEFRKCELTEENAGTVEIGGFYKDSYSFRAVGFTSLVESLRGCLKNT